MRFFALLLCSPCMRRPILQRAFSRFFCVFFFSATLRYYVLLGSAAFALFSLVTRFSSARHGRIAVPPSQFPAVRPPPARPPSIGTQVADGLANQPNNHYCFFFPRGRAPARAAHRVGADFECARGSGGAGRVASASSAAGS